MAKIKRIDHIALVVESMDEALSFWRDSLGLELAEVEVLPSEAARVAFFPVGGSKIELVRPVTDDSGLAKYLKKHGPGMHHVCLEVEGIREVLHQLRARGVKLIDMEPKVADDGRQYAFIHPKAVHGVLVELYEYP